MPHRLATIAAHAGALGHAAGQPVMPPISLSTTFVQESPGVYEEHAYSRVSNPNRDALEHSLALLEGGADAAVFASGCAAMHAVLQLLGRGDHLVACADLYGGTYRLIEQLVRPLGVDVSWVDLSDLASVEQTMRDSTEMLWVETPTNPLLRVFDIEALSSLAHENGALCVVDSTFATPVLQRPIECGADVVVHSLSKYMNGHSDVLGGAVISNVKDRRSQRIRLTQRAGGAVLSPFDCYLVARGMKTLPLRMARHCENAHELAKWLATRDDVTAVHYPGLSNHPQHALAARQMAGFGGMLSFEVRGGHRRVRSILSRVQLFALAESLGGVESLIGQPASMSHASMPEDARKARGIKDGLIRVSVGLEDVEDLREDLDRALHTP
ncbi:MAG: aminotransferase class I/II-fold pyridoxal phosphate-dependent enzyme [Myxococcales bacterium]